MQKEQTYKIMRIALIIFIAGGIGFAIAIRNLIAGGIIFIIGLFLSIFLRKRYKDIVIADERTRRISEKAFTGAFMIYAVSIGIANLAIVFLESLNLETINQIKPAIYQLSYAFFIIIALYWVLYIYYQRKM